MAQNDLQRPRYTFERTSRRGFLKGAAALALTRPSFALAQGQAKSLKGPILAYVGTYSSPQGPEGSKGNGDGHSPVSNGPFNRGSVTRERLCRWFESVLARLRSLPNTFVRGE